MNKRSTPSHKLVEIWNKSLDDRLKGTRIDAMTHIKQTSYWYSRYHHQTLKVIQNLNMQVKFLYSEFKSLAKPFIWKSSLVTFTNLQNSVNYDKMGNLTCCTY